MTLAITARLAFGLAFDVEKADTRSGYRPADTDLGSRRRLFGQLRLEGFAAMMRLGFAPMFIVVGGNEGRYKDERPIINRAEAIKAMLVDDHGISPDLIDAIPSASNTLGNIAIIKEKVGKHPHRACAVVSNHYHLPRAEVDVLGAGLSVPAFAAEAFLLIEGKVSKAGLAAELGGGPLAERCAEEIQGIADKLTGKYKSKTDIPVYSVSDRWWMPWKKSV